MGLRDILPAIPRITAWWRRRIALRRAPRPSDLERLKRVYAEARRKHRPTDLVRRQLEHATHARLAAEQGKALHERKFQ